MDAIVFGNVTLDIICRTVDEVPRFESLSFENAEVSPGGCGSNVAIGLSALGITTSLICHIGQDIAGRMIKEYWGSTGIDTRFVIQETDRNTAVSIGLIDHDAQPRFIHTPGANVCLSVDDLNIEHLLTEGARFLHVGGFFVLPGLLDGRFPAKLAEARRAGITTSLDVVRSRQMSDPSTLWSCMPEIDIFLCNQQESIRLTGKDEPVDASVELRKRGAHNVFIKLGADGCWVNSDQFTGEVPAPEVDVVDTTGAGDAFAAGLIAALSRDADMVEACIFANQAGARMASAMGAVGGWK